MEKIAIEESGHGHGGHGHGHGHDCGDESDGHGHGGHGQGHDAGHECGEGCEEHGGERSRRSRALMAVVGPNSRVSGRHAGFWVSGRVKATLGTDSPWTSGLSAIRSALVATGIAGEMRLWRRWQTRCNTQVATKTLANTMQHSGFTPLGDQRFACTDVVALRPS